MAAAAIPRAALTPTRARHAAGRAEPGPDPARMPARPHPSGARGRMGGRHPALPVSGPGIAALQAGARVARRRGETDVMTRYVIGPGRRGPPGS